jgi:hypothetical protein
MIFGVLNPDLNLQFMNLQFTIGRCQLNFFKIMALTVIIMQSPFSYAQNDTIKYNVTLMGLTSTGANSPFWLHSRQFGKISSQSNSADVMLGVNKDFGDRKRLFDYGFKAIYYFKPTIQLQTCISMNCMLKLDC